jgi:polar amino acid transport system substrate-binding protein
MKSWWYGKLEPTAWRLRRRTGWFAALALASLLLAHGAPAQTPALPAPDLPARASDADSLRGGWYPWDPYQDRDYRRGVPVLTGFDVEIERALARAMGVEIRLPEIAWQDHLADLAAGTADIAAGATVSETRRGYAYFSKPYRTETDVLILPRGASGRYTFRTIDEMLDTFARSKFRLGVVAGFVYADERVNAFIGDPTHRDQILPVATDAQNLRNLLSGVVDGLLADRIAAATTAWRRQEGAYIEEHPLRFSTDIHFMLSRATQTPQTLARLDDAIDTLQRSGEFRRIADFYALPVLINQTLDTGWFRALAFLGTVAFALSGVVLAYAGQYSLFGALILASLPAVGGGIVRDLLLQREPLAIVRSPEALLTVFGTVLVGMATIRIVARIGAHRLVKPLRSHPRLGTSLIEICDAVGLAAFTVVGVVVVLDTLAQPLWLWGPISAVLTSAFGGLLRDLFRHDRVIATLRAKGSE